MRRSLFINLFALRVFRSTFFWKKLIKQSILQNIFIIAFLSIWITSSVYLSEKSITFLLDIPFFGDLLMKRLVYLSFFSLMTFSFISSFVLSFSKIFNSKEFYFLLTLPETRAKIIFFYSCEVAVMASWAILFFSLPLHYGFLRSCDISFYKFFFFIIIIFPILLISSFSGVSAAVIIRGRRFYRSFFSKKVLLFILCALVIYSFIKLNLRYVALNDLNLFVENILSFFEFSTKNVYPSTWAAKSFIKLYFQGVFPVQGILTIYLAAFFIIMIFYLFLTLSVKSIINNMNFSRQEGVGFSLLKKIQPQYKIIIFKDLQYLLRDPAQYMQLFLFIALIFFYFLNMNNSYLTDLAFFWRNIIIHLNLVSVELALCAFATRFFYPQISLEGRSVWILSLSLLKTKDILKAKRRLAVIICITISLLMNAFTLFVIGTSCYEFMIIILIASVSSLFIAVSSVNFGVIYADLRAESMAEIVSGLGPTVSFLITMFFVLIPVSISIFINKIMHTQKILSFTPYITFIVIYTLFVYIFLRFQNRQVDNKLKNLFYN